MSDEQQQTHLNSLKSPPTVRQSISSTPSAMMMMNDSPLIQLHGNPSSINSF